MDPTASTPVSPRRPSVSAMDPSPAPARPAEPALPTPSSSDTGQPLKPNACISCQRRKVKCDRLEPCSSCKRYRAVCEFRDPAPRRKRKLSDEDLHAKLDRYESILNRFGARADGRPEDTPSEAPASAAPSAPAPSFTPLNAPRQRPQASNRSTPHEQIPSGHPGPEAGRLIFEKGSSRYLENSLWKGISDEFRTPGDMLRLSSSTPAPYTGTGASPDASQIDPEELVLGLVPNPSGGLRNMHPQPPHIFLLWQTFLDNVNPLVKLLHTPTVQRQILKAASNLDAVDAETEVLMFAIYTFAVTSLSQDECQSSFGESKDVLLKKFQYATKVALHQAGFLRSSQLVVLQAYILYLLAMRPYYDIQTLWSLSAIAVRMGQRIGIHRDGSQMGLPLFDIEMRRRVWWQLMPLDIRTAQLAGGVASLFTRLWDTQTPLNVNDSELNPDMKQLPVEHTGPTEMFFCLLRYNFGKFLRRSAMRPDLLGDLPDFNGAEVSLAEKDQAIDGMEREIEENFLKHCDPSVPLHYMTAIVARCATCMMRLLAHHPRQYSDKGLSIPQSEKDLLFRTSLKQVELDNLGHSEPSLQRFMWHMDAFFQWEAFIFVLAELRTRTTVAPTSSSSTNASDTQPIENVWRTVNKCLEFHADILNISRNPLHSAVASLCAKAWGAYAAEAAREKRAPQPDLSDYPALEVLVSRARAARLGGVAEVQQEHQHQQAPARASSSAGLPEAVAVGRAADAQDAAGKAQVEVEGEAADGWAIPGALDASPLDWEVWDEMLAEFGLGTEVFGGFAANAVVK